MSLFGKKDRMDEILRVLELMKKQQQSIVDAYEIIEDLNNRLLAIEAYIKGASQKSNITRVQ